jgi:hypothetical protein
MRELNNVGKKKVKLPPTNVRVKWVCLAKGCGESGESNNIIEAYEKDHVHCSPWYMKITTIEKE